MKPLHFLLIAFTLLFLSIPRKTAGATSMPGPADQAITTPNQMIAAVNNLRIANGLKPLEVHPILMQSAQSQADYMAATGQVTHARPGGGTYTQQLLALGFPLAGDLSLGGFRAENILSTGSPLVWNGVPPAWQDADHMNTMLSQNFTHIGAGISQNANGYYYAVDCAAVTGSGQMQDSAGGILTAAPGADSGNSSGISQYMVPIVKSTARPDGSVVHKVQYGQTLWSIAIEYGTTIKNIQSLNNLGDDTVVQQGQELIVLQGATQPPPSTPTLAPVSTNTPPPPTFTPGISLPEGLFATFTPQPTLSALETPVRQAAPSSSSRTLVVVLIIAAFVGAGMAVWLIRDPKP